jgi:hypothetical protein
MRIYFSKLKNLIHADYDKGIIVAADSYSLRQRANVFYYNADGTKWHFSAIVKVFL